VNEYTRRGETSWILVSAIVLVASVGGSLGLLLTAKGPLVPDQAAIDRASRAAELSKTVSACESPAKRFDEELGVLKGIADAAALEDQPAPEPAPAPPRRSPGAPAPKPKPKPALELAWPGVKPTHELARSLATCREAVAGLVEPSAEAARAWDAIAAASTIEAPADAARQVDVAKQVVAATRGVTASSLVEQVSLASKVASTRALELAAAAESARIQSPLPKGLLGREAAIAAGVVVSLLALLVSFFSLRATSLRRLSSLVGLRARGADAAPGQASGAPSRAGLQAATILRLAGEPNGGEPGLVLGAAVGGLVAAIALRLDADFYIVGVLAGLVIGVLIQVVSRRVARAGDFRARAMALAEIEKPTVSIVLVLGTIQPGLEDDFLDFFMALPPLEAAHAVEKLAHQAEERILAAADAQALG
jgi:hypothetical protein